MKLKSYHKIIIVAVVVVITGVLLYFLNQNQIPKVISREGIAYERAVVTNVMENTLEKHELTGAMTGTQKIEIRLLTGEQKGEVHQATNYASYINNVICEKGTKLLISISNSQNVKTYSVYTYDRTTALLVAIVLFCLLLCLIGGKKGLKALLSLALTFFFLLYLFIPLLYMGVSPIWAAIILVIIATFITMMLIDGWNAKTISAIIGTIICTSVSGILALVAGHFLKISDYSMGDVDSLIQITQNTELKLDGLMFASILIVSMGAVMDICMSIASAVNELYIQNPDMTTGALFRSGVSIGRDTMGTMSNTLILAFTGGYLTAIVSLFAYSYTLYEIFSQPDIINEIIQGLAGSAGLFLAVPIVAFVTSRLLKKFEVK